MPASILSILSSSRCFFSVFLISDEVELVDAVAGGDVSQEEAGGLSSLVGMPKLFRIRYLSGIAAHFSLEASDAGFVSFVGAIELSCFVSDACCVGCGLVGMSTTSLVDVAESKLDIDSEPDPEFPAERSTGPSFEREGVFEADVAESYDDGEEASTFEHPPVSVSKGGSEQSAKSTPMNDSERHISFDFFFFGNDQSDGTFAQRKVDSVHSLNRSFSRFRTDIADEGTSFKIVRIVLTQSMDALDSAVNTEYVSKSGIRDLFISNIKLRDYDRSAPSIVWQLLFLSCKTIVRRFKTASILFG